MLDLATMVLITIVLLAVVTVAQGVGTLPQGEVWSVERFDAFMRMRQPAPDLIIPDEGRRPSLQEVMLDIPEPVEEADTRISPGARR